MRIWSLAVSFQTTDDDKDESNMVWISVYRQNDPSTPIVKRQVCFGTTWNNGSWVWQFGLWFNQPYESHDLALMVEKDKSEGWTFNVNVDGIDPSGNQQSVLQQNGLRLVGGNNSTGLMNLS